MTIAPGWYAVPETTDVRWWDGHSFREVTLVDGAPRYRFSWGLPVGNYLLAAVVVLVVAIVGLFIAGGEFPVVTLVSAPLALWFFIIAVLAMKTLRLAPPTTAPIETNDVQPLPGTVEPGLVAAGWYAGPTKEKPRWWTGKQWSDYLLAFGQPHPASGQAARVKRIHRRILWVSLAIVALCAGGAVACALAGQLGPMTALIAFAVIALAVGIGYRVAEHRAMRPFIRPMLPPTGQPLA